VSPRFVSGAAESVLPQVQAPDSSVIRPLSADCFLYGLGPTSAAQGGGQVSSAAGFANFLPRFAIVDTARTTTPGARGNVCRDQGGEIVIFDKAYVDSNIWPTCHARVFWVTRAKDNMQFQVVQSYNREWRAKFCG